VLTAHSGKEAIAMLKRFPNVDAITIDAGLKDLDCGEIARQMRAIQPDVPIVAISPNLAAKCGWADHTINSYEPRQLLDLLEKLGGRTTI
jgi:CheY-like chemotaxis protein